MSFIEKLLDFFVPWKSHEWVVWRSTIDPRTCWNCVENNGKIFASENVGKTVICPEHFGCRCRLVGVDVLPAGYATQDGLNGADYWLVHRRKLPDNYITKREARKIGWKSKKGNLADVAKGKIIGGDIYHNNKGLLPQKDGRIWYEADINYTSGHRGTDRIFYSNDGLIFASYNHGATFYEISK